MTLPIYADASKAAPSARGAGANTGLWFSRFFDGFEADFSIRDTGKSEWLMALAKLPVGDPSQLGSAADAMRQLVAANGGACVEVQTDSPLATGLGLSHPVENGFTFHPTYGVPFLCGGAVKGFLRSWVELWMEFADEAQRQVTVKRWFGAAAGTDHGDTEAAGGLIFFDALPTKPVQMSCDVLTPHMGGWYESGGSIRVPGDFARMLPADWHNPVPSPFLVVNKGMSFLFGISFRPDASDCSDADVQSAASELRKALDWVGIGAKTAAGYGRMADRKARESAQQAERLQQAGIASGEEEWPAATLSWDKGRSALTIRNPKTGRICKGTTEHFGALSEATRKKLEKSKPVTASAVVRIRGNQVDLVRVKEST